MDMEHFHDFVKSKKKPSSSVEVQNSLRKEIMQLEKRLQDQVAVRCALEKALGYGSSSHKTTAETPITKPTRELIREIAVLEVEVGHLEQYLLSLYRQAFDQQLTSLSPPRRDDRLKPHASGTPRRRLNFSKSDALFRTEASKLPMKESNAFAEVAANSDFRVQRSHSSLSQRSGLPNRTLTPEDTLGKSVRACHSQPLSMREYAQNASSNMFSLGERVFNHITTDHVPETPNKLSEEMIKCMSTIYCKLADPPLTTNQLGASSPTNSAFSSPNPYSHDGLWSPGFRNVSSFDVRLDNPFHVEGLKDFSGPYSTMIEIQCIYRDNHKLCEIEPLLQYYRSLICQLDETELSSLKTHEEKLAFWINIHNALVMHAYLAYGIPQSSMKKVFLLLKAAYNVGGCIISADAIQTSILKCRMSRPGQWIRVLLSSKAKFRTEDKRQAFVLEHPEPLLHFALSSGNHSDPAVRLYTPKRVFRELEAAKEEYTRATFGVAKENKILLPKVVESFAKDSGMSSAGVVEMVWQSLPDSLRKKSISMTKKFQLRKGRKNIEWVPHNFAFRYLIFKELVR